MDWGQSYSASWRIFKVNRDTWADGQKLAKVDSVSVSRNADGSLLESGGMSVSGDFEEDYYRIVMTAEQGGEVQRVDVATLLFISTGGTYDYNENFHEIDGFSVLYPADKTAVTTGEYAPAGVDGARYAGELLASAINAPVQVEGSFTLNEHVVHEFGSSVLEAVWAVLEAGNFVMQIDGRGVVHILPKPTEPKFLANRANLKVMSNGISYKSDTSDIPNRYVVIDDTMITTAENNSPLSVISTVNRGYTVDVIDTKPTPINGETYAKYASRKLEEASVLKEEKTYNREYQPDVFVYDIVRGSIDGIQGDYRIEAQTVNCGNGITVNETATKETKLWSTTM